MAIRITSPEHSFVRFSDQNLMNDDAISWDEYRWPGAQLGFAIPFSLNTDLAFQFIIEGDTEAEIDAICLIDLSKYKFKISYGTFLGPTLLVAQYLSISGTEFSFAPYIEMYRLNGTQVLLYVSSLANLTPVGVNIPEGACFQIAIAVQHGPIFIDLYTAVSNVFKYIGANTQYTTVIEYDSEVDEASFYYEPAPTIENRVRLPLYLTRPTLPEEESLHRLSNGTTTVTKAVIRKQFEVVVDAMPIWTLEALRAIWIHDRAEIVESLVYEGEVVKEGAFEIDYVEYLNHPFGKAKFKVSASPYLLRKNNCGEANDYSGLLLMADFDLGAIIWSHTYTLDLASGITAACCAPLSYSLVYYQSNKIQSISLVGSVVTITTRGSALAVGMPDPFVRVKVSCGGIDAYTSISIS